MASGSNSRRARCAGWALAGDPGDQLGQQLERVRGVRVAGPGRRPDRGTTDLGQQLVPARPSREEGLVVELLDPRRVAEQVPGVDRRLARGGELRDEAVDRLGQQEAALLHELHHRGGHDRLGDRGDRAQRVEPRPGTFRPGEGLVPNDPVRVRHGEDHEGSLAGGHLPGGQVERAVEGGRMQAKRPGHRSPPGTWRSDGGDGPARSRPARPGRRRPARGGRRERPASDARPSGPPIVDPGARRLRRAAGPPAGRAASGRSISKRTGAAPGRGVGGPCSRRMRSARRRSRAAGRRPQPGTRLAAGIGAGGRDRRGRSSAPGPSGHGSSRQAGAGPAAGRPRPAPPRRPSACRDRRPPGARARAGRSRRRRPPAARTRSLPPPGPCTGPPPASRSRTGGSSGTPAAPATMAAAARWRSSARRL